ncbi:MAG: LysR family transcriptional regulator [Xanthobacteraceae bacterium]
MTLPKLNIERTDRRLKLRDLRILLTVAECGTMGKAAKRLAVSQPVVSKAISDMEHAVGVRLLDRSQRGVEPTPYGRALIKRGVAIFDEMQQGLRDIEFLTDPTAGEVRVGATGPVSAAIVAPAIEQLSRQYPRMRFKAITGDTVALLDALEARKADLVISRIGLRMPQGHTIVILFHDEPKVVTGSKNPLTRRRTIALADLLNEPWIFLPPGGPFGSVQAAVFRTSGLEPPQPAIETLALPLRAALLGSHRFLSIVPGFSIVLPRPHPELVALPVKLKVAREPVGIVTLKNRSLNPAAQMFIECVRELTKPLAKSNQAGAVIASA